MLVERQFPFFHLMLILILTSTFPWSSYHYRHRSIIFQYLCCFDICFRFYTYWISRESKRKYRFIKHYINMVLNADRFRWCFFDLSAIMSCSLIHIILLKVCYWKRFYIHREFVIRSFFKIQIPTFVCISWKSNSHGFALKSICSVWAFLSFRKIQHLSLTHVLYNRLP